MSAARMMKKLTNKSVLFVDDEPYVLSALKRGLLNEGFKLVTASSAGEALNLLKNEEFQIVVADYDMPYMLGPEFLDRVKVMQPSAIRVVLTGSSDLRTIQHFMRVGQAMRYLLKPWDLDEIRSTLQECFELFSETQSLSTALAKDKL